MRIKCKLRNIGHSRGVILPSQVITDRLLGEDIELDVITKQGNDTPEVITKTLFQEKVITPVITKNLEPEPYKKEFFNTAPCEKHPGSMKGTCGCQ